MTYKIFVMIWAVYVSAHIVNVFIDLSDSDVYLLIVIAAVSVGIWGSLSSLK